MFTQFAKQVLETYKIEKSIFGRAYECLLFVPKMRPIPLAPRRARTPYYCRRIAQSPPFQSRKPSSPFGAIATANAHSSYTSCSVNCEYLILIRGAYLYELDQNEGASVWERIRYPRVRKHLEVTISNRNSEGMHEV